MAEHRPPLSLLAFAIMEYDRRGWVMPDVHVRIYQWLQDTEGARNRVMMVFRGCGKSTILGVRNAHKFYTNPKHQVLVQGADDELTDDISRDTIAILRANEMTRNVLMEPAGVRHWWTREGYENTARTPQLRGRGILSRVTGNRADEIINDDTEVSKNVETVEARAKLRKRLSEQGFILKPDGSKLWVGTPHAHDSIYEQHMKAGAQALVIPLFQHQTRFELSDEPKTDLQFAGEIGPDGVWVFSGIGAFAKMLDEGADFTVTGPNSIRLHQPAREMIDVCVGNAWPDRFHRAEMLERRRECETTNYWDQQYGLQAKPLNTARLDPNKLPIYAVEPTFKTANKHPQLWLGSARIVGAAMRWDPSSGKLRSDTSALSLVFQDEHGVRYWHRAEALVGEVAVFDERDNKTITGGQVAGICDMVAKFRVRRVTVETNGIGGFAPTVLRAALKQRGLVCGVTEVQATQQKNKRILEAFEPLMLSRMLWVHVSVADGPVPAQMREWNPAITNQPDDHLDAGAGAVTDQPERLDFTERPSADGESGRIRHAVGGDDWRPGSGVFEAELEV